MWRSGSGLLMGQFHQFLTELFARDTLVFLFLDDNLSKFQWIFSKPGMCVDIMEIWFGIAKRSISSIFDRVFCLQHIRIFDRVICTWHDNLETICMKCQILFFRKIRKISSVEFAHSMVLWYLQVLYYFVYPKYLDMWHLIRVHTVCHTSSSFLDTSRGSQTNFLLLGQVW